MKNLRYFCAFFASFIASAYADEPLPDLYFANDAPPVVLTASRLKQPKTETPASVTVIEAAQIEAWGARSIPEVLRFVPGMFVGESQKENTPAVVYHAATQNLARRLQVLVDGRSVYKAAIARVVWDDIPVAVEDIARIEVIRGPSSAMYGANAFMATINIITKAPEDTLGTRLASRVGNQGVRDVFLSHADLAGESSYRISANYQSDDGLDGPKEWQDDGQDNWRDDIRSKHVAMTYERPLWDKTQWRVDLGLVHNDAQIQNSRSSYDIQDRENNVISLESKLKFEFSENHKSHLQMYWQKEQRDHEKRERMFTIFLDPNLAELYRQNPEATAKMAKILDDLGRLTPAELAQGAALQQELQNLVSSLPPEQQALYQNLQTNFYASMKNGKPERVVGTLDFGYEEQRIDVEWQDTLIWHERLRTVSGLSLRYDEAYSATFFNNDYRTNTIYRAFANIEWRMLDSLIFNAGGMYEQEDINDRVFSPRVAVNWLLTEQQSLRLVYSQAVRSPDMLEQSPDTSPHITDLTENYLNLTETMLFQTQRFVHRGLKHEKISSYELGYFANFPSIKAELDIKLYHDKMKNLISGDPTNVDDMQIMATSTMNIRGIEAQGKWMPSAKDWLWLTAAYMDVDLHLNFLSEHCEETCLSPKYSATTSWFHQWDGFNSTLSYLWLNALSDNRFTYQRTELNLRKNFQLGQYKPWAGVFWQYQISQQPLGYDTQYLTKRNTYFLQLGMNF